MLVPTLALALAFAFVGFQLGRRIESWWPWLLGAAAAIPAVAYASYYVHLVDEPMLLYVVRSLRGSELLASGLGLLIGLAAERLLRRRSVLRGTAVGVIAVIAAGLLVLPYVKPLLRPADWTAFENRWNGGVAMQSTLYSCGPAAAATLLASQGTTVTEEQLAREAFTCSSGTENWYLARAIRDNGHTARFVRSAGILAPAIAGVHGPQGGHFIAVISHENGEYLVADPLIGPQTYSEQALRKRYVFSGFYMVVE